jgi:hypothetical protein
VDKLDANYEASHCGFPPDSCPDFVQYAHQAIPEEDPSELFGFNQNIHNRFKQDEVNKVFC